MNKIIIMKQTFVVISFFLILLEFIDSIKFLFSICSFSFCEEIVSISDRNSFF